MVRGGTTITEKCQLTKITKSFTIMNHIKMSVIICFSFPKAISSHVIICGIFSNDYVEISL